MNITDIQQTSLHQAFEASNKSATARGLRITGSELVGLVPLKVMLDAGKHFLQKQGLSVGVSDAELIHIAVKSMGLDELAPFDPKKKIIEYVLQDGYKGLVDLTMSAFSDELASDSPAPGGGSVAAYAGALAASLGTMVANLSAVKKGWEDQLEKFSSWAEKGQQGKATLIKLVDEDTAAFNKVMDAFRLPKATDAEKKIRQEAIESATKYAIEIPLKTMHTTVDLLTLLEEMAASGNPNSASDVGVGALCARTAIEGAWMNVVINLPGLKDKAWGIEKKSKADDLLQSSIKRIDAIVEKVKTKL